MHVPKRSLDDVILKIEWKKRGLWRFVIDKV
jgi:hypothetical protein